MLHAYVKKDITNGSIAVISGEKNGLIEIEPVTKENNTGKLVRVIEGIFEDIMDSRLYKNNNNNKYIIKVGEFCRVERIENVKENEEVG